MDTSNPPSIQKIINDSSLNAEDKTKILALDKYNFHIFKKYESKLPWKVENGNYKIRGTLIRLQCVPCLVYCTSCSDGYLLIKKADGINTCHYS